MFHVKLYRDCDIGGAHSGGLNIPGLIAKEKDASTSPQRSSSFLQSNYHDILQGFVKDSQSNKVQSDLTGIDVNADMNWYKETYGTKGYVAPGTNTGDPLIPSSQLIQNQQNKGLHGSPPPTPKYRKSQDLFDYQHFMDLLKKNNAKSEFEIIIDYLFSFVEKLDFLKSLGYEHILGDKVRSSSVEEGLEVTESVQQAFLREITKKFKNVLLAKGTIKIKF